MSLLRVEPATVPPTARHDDLFNSIITALFPLPPCRTPRDAVSKFTSRTVEKYGLLPWQIGIYSKKLTDAFQSRATGMEARTNAAFLAYYVAAAHDPFNTTTDSDGALGGQPGVNQRASTLAWSAASSAIFLREAERSRYWVRDPTEHASDMVLSAHSWLENILLADIRAHEGLSSYGDDYYDRFYAQAGAVLIRQSVGRFHRRRLLLDDRVDQCRSPAIAVALRLRALGCLV